MKKRIDEYRPFSKRLADSLHEKLIIEWTYNSNAIEGNTLTLSETKVVLEGITIGGKSVIEHLEAINHREAILFIEELIGKNEPLSEWHIKNIHGLILKEIDNQNAGKYRMENVVIGGATHIPLKHYEVDLLMQNGYTPIIIKKEDQAQYYEVLDHAHTTMDYHPFLEFVAKLVIESEELWLSLL